MLQQKQRIKDRDHIVMLQQNYRIKDWDHVVMLQQKHRLKDWDLLEFHLFGHLLIADLLCDRDILIRNKSKGGECGQKKR
ncbi:hypothetical protein RRG08_055710 [Elysia crispata]|uniref:Uncharacterized protein n=1 Tax=Elysia crispata TaxID=231223 RepID=A0AAE1E7A3_9GAST|nr:hypothetical protein RRG08_055710 [Elysia crispata]